MYKKVVRYGTVEQSKALFPNKLYKFRNWNDLEKFKFHKDIISQMELYFPNPKEFEDKFDCRFPIEFDFSFETMRTRMRNSYFSSNGIKTLNNAQLDSLIKYNYKERFGTIEKQKEKEDEFYTDFRNTLAIYSFSKSNDNLKMWEKYGDNFNGFCVGFNFRENLESLQCSLLFGTEIEYVEYESEKLPYPSSFNDKNEDDFSELFIDLISKKYKLWNFENEFRLCKQNFDELNFSNIPAFNNKFQIPKGCFFELIFGYKMEQKYRLEIEKYCEVNKLPVSFKIAEYHNGIVEIRNI